MRVPILLVLSGLALGGCAGGLAAPITPAHVAVSEAAGTVTVDAPACPNWSRRSREDFSNRNTSNFGCADALNFARQLDDPRDALRGRSLGAQDGGAAASAVDRYRTRKTVPLATGGSQSGGTPAAAAPEGGS